MMQASARTQAAASINRQPSCSVLCTFACPTITPLILRQQSLSLLHGAAPRQLRFTRQRLLPARYRNADEVPLPPQSASGPDQLPEPRDQPQTAAPPPPPQARAQLKIIGLGPRGISAVNRLIGSGSLQPDAEFWALDSDRKVLTAADPSARVLAVAAGDDTTLPQADLAALAGEGTEVPALPETPDGQAGAVFVLGSAFGSPGGAAMLLQLVRHLRRCGYFVAAALTRPFDFEGPRRLEVADTLIGTLREVAHLVVVISQGVLIRASADLTMSQAQAIADTTLVHTVQSTLWALRVPEALMMSHGAFLWHGRDLRHFRRPLFPPMMNLLSCPGYATLGRGQASLPLPLLHQAGLASALSTLAEDAVKAASESPFLDNKLGSATGVLCVVRVPPSALGISCGGAEGREEGESGPGSSGDSSGGSSAHGGGLLAADNHEEYALRSAVQVAAMTVRELVGPHCHDIIVCPQLCQDLEDDQVVAADSSGNTPHHNNTQAEDMMGAMSPGGGVPLVRLEVSLLVLEGIEEAAEPRSVADHTNTSAQGAAKHHNHRKPPAAFTSSISGAAATAPPDVSAPFDPPAAAIARDRMSASTGSRPHPHHRHVDQRLPPPGTPTLASNFFRGELPSGAGGGGSSRPPPSPPPQQQQQQRSVSPLTSPSLSPRSLSPPRPPASTSSSSLSGAGVAPRVGSSAGDADAAAGAGAGVNSALFAGRSGALSTLDGVGSDPNSRNSMSEIADGAHRWVPAATTRAAIPAAEGTAATPAGPTAAHWDPTVARSSGVRTPLAASGASAPANSSGPGAASATAAAVENIQLRRTRLATMGGFRQQQSQTSQMQSRTPVVEGAAKGGREGARGGGGGDGVVGSGAGGRAGDLQQIPRLAENLVTSLVAQSLDLPPQAARWRHQRRSPPPDRSHSSYVFTLPRVDGGMMLSGEEGEWMEEHAEEEQQGDGLGRGLQRFIMGMRLPGLGPDGSSFTARGGAGGGSAADVRSRVAVMLDMERNGEFRM